MLTHNPKALYAAFDVFPAPKGASTHIHYMAKTLFEAITPGCLYTLGGHNRPCYQLEDNFEILRFSTPQTNFLERTVAYGNLLSRLLDKHDRALKICHFRDPWSGLPILEHRYHGRRKFLCLYEVNGLPSIELPYTYPNIRKQTIEKIHQQELYCLHKSDHIITPSAITQAHLVHLGIPLGKISVIRNGANPIDLADKPEAAPKDYLIYVGAPQHWQGIADLLRAFSYLRDFKQLQLVLCLSKRNQTVKQYERLARKLNCADNIMWLFDQPQAQIANWLYHATIAVAPLTDCSRNTTQGCCPLKILESMAAGTPVVASNLAVVREIMTDQQHGSLVRAGRPEVLALAIRALLDHPEMIKTMGQQARKHIQQTLTWQHTQAQLTELYNALVSRSSDTMVPAL